ncbi:MAG: beta-propeller domain-containing protein [Candidatus Gribaldobacteria bacterium]|nr:beta-propeller domain-containing protein [Candidatus Gribaldobacteria bacterium]
MEFNINGKRALIILVVAGALGFGTVLAVNHFYPAVYFPEFTLDLKPPVLPTNISEMKGFASGEEFKAYLQQSQSLVNQGGFGMGMGVRNEMAVDSVGVTAPKATTASPAPVASPDRVSGTNVQVLGIDEPDVVKTNGTEIYYSKNPIYYFSEPMPMTDKMIAPPRNYQGGIEIIKAFPISDLAVTAKIDQAGEMLLADKKLVVFGADKIIGYDVSDSKNPVQKWSFKLDYRNNLLTSRLKDNKIYLVLRNDINQNQPCPLRPVTLEQGSFEIKCSNIYHPVQPIPVDSTFTVLKIDPANGNIENSLAFVGSAGQSVVYVSQDNLYVTYSYTDDTIKFFYNFLDSQAKDLVPSWVLTKLQKLMGYDLSYQAKITELSSIMGDFQNSLSQDDQLKTNNEISNRLASYQKDHQRELEKTGIAKVSLDNLKIVALGNVPGHPLNQFSLDEYDNHLRIATTIGGGWMSWGYIAGDQSQSVNDVYVLDSGLKLTGSILGLGQGERIYAARFLGNQGYLVTFKQTDPFYVLDLSNPQKPVQTGELKIPGYSAYLHPLADNRILGVGKEGQQVKLSLFNIKDPANPIEIAKYNLDEYWTDVADNHHAFLQDAKHQVFFIPGGRGGYIFSYQNDQLSLVKAVSDVAVKRALYINDYLYIIADSQIIILNESDWSKVKELEL